MYLINKNYFCLHLSQTGFFSQMKNEKRWKKKAKSEKL